MEKIESTLRSNTRITIVENTIILYNLFIHGYTVASKKALSSHLVAARAV